MFIFTEVRNKFMKQYKCYIFYLSVYFFTNNLFGQVYLPDLGNGMYQNPIIHADYSDPDVLRVGKDFYMVSSSFNCVPGLPILHSNDLVNWEIVNHVLPELRPKETFDVPQHGNGVWAPSIRFHDQWYYVYYGDPDLGIFMIKTRDPRLDWEEPVLVKSAKGWIDPCPLWDDDGNAFLIHAFAGSRAGNKSILVINKMSPDGTTLLDDGVLVFDGHETHATIEGPKLYKRNDYYYIFAPAGGVTEGWQSVLRSKNIYGPYEIQDVLHQGNTNINGPHQGAWVSLESGEDWFIHFQDKGPYGRIIHLQPAHWENDWIKIGMDQNNDGKGEPVLKYQKPDVGQTYKKKAPQTSDEFNTLEIGLQWQWHGNPKPLWFFTTNLGYLRLNPVIVGKDTRLWDLPNLLLQKFPAETFTAETKLTPYLINESEEVGLVVTGLNYSYISLRKENDNLVISIKQCKDADKGGSEIELVKDNFESKDLYLSVRVDKAGRYQYAYSKDGRQFINFGPEFQAKEGKWIGSKLGLFFKRNEHVNNGGYTNVDYFRISK